MPTARRGALSIFSSFSRSYLAIFGLGALVVLIAFAVIRKHALLNEQHGEVSSYVAEMARVVENSASGELDAALVAYLHTLSGRRLLDCIHVRVAPAGQDQAPSPVVGESGGVLRYSWPFWRCVDSRGERLQGVEVPLRAEARSLHATFSLDPEGISGPLFSEIIAVAGAGLVITTLSLLALSISFRRTVSAPLSKLRQSFGSSPGPGAAQRPRVGVEVAELEGLLEAYRTLAERESRLARESAYRHAIIDTAFDCIVSINSDGKIVEFNPAAERTFAVAKEDALGRNLAALLVPDRHRAAHGAGLERYLATGESRIMGRRFRTEALRGDGREIPVELSVRAVEVENEKLFTASIRDITAELAQEESLKRSKLLAEESSRTKSLFLATVSHEIRSPLNAILGSIEVLQDMTLESDPAQYVDIAANAGRTLLSLIEDVLDMSRIEAGELRLALSPLSLPGLARNVQTVLTLSARDKGLSLDAVVADGLPASVLGDEARIRQVLINLVTNAIKFTDEGSVRLRIDEAARPATYRFSVEDTGIGLTPDEVSRIFEPFDQVDSGLTRQRAGVGLGLAISRRLVEAMGGVIEVESTPGEGARFFFDLELAAAPGAGTPARGLPDTGDAAQPAEAGHRVLIAEDSPSNQAVMRAYLRGRGFRVDIASDGQEAVEAAATGGYDVILMDVSMPNVDGIEATRRLRALAGDVETTPIIALTAHALEEVRERCLAAGMTDFLTKPVSRGRLLDMIDRHLDAGAARRRA